MSVENPYLAPEVARGEVQLQAGEELTFRQSRQQRNNGEYGLLGWPLLLAIGLGVSLINNLLFAMAMLGFVGNGDAPAWMLAVFPSLAAFAAACIGLFCFKSRWFPRLALAYLVALPAVFAVLFFGKFLPAELHLNGAIVRTTAYAILWGTYLLSSDRVRNTFDR